MTRPAIVEWFRRKIDGRSLSAVPNHGVTLLAGNGDMFSGKRKARQRVIEPLGRIPSLGSVAVTA